MANAGPAATVADAIDARSLVDLVVAAVGVPSVTPHEKRFAHWVRDELARGGWDQVELRDAEPGRPNVYAASGAGDGRSLVLAGHLDTVHGDDWAAHWQGTDRADPFAARLVDGEIWGRGAADLKGGICTIIEVLRAVGRAGFRLRGRVHGLFVCDEESGQPGCGLSAGMRAAVRDRYAGAGETPDFAIYAEPTNAAVYTAQMGFLIAEITLTGRSAYFGTPELGVDALRAGHALLAALWEHDRALRAGDAHDLLGGRFLLVTHVRAGESIAVPERFELSLIHKLLPGDDLDRAADALRGIATRTACEFGVAQEVRFTAPRDHPVGGTPDEVPADHPGVAALARSIATTTGADARIEGAPYWSEKPLLHAVGIPGVYFAAGDIACCHTAFERLPVDQLVAAARTLAHFVVSWCGVTENTRPPT